MIHNRRLYLRENKQFLTEEKDPKYIKVIKKANKGKDLVYYIDGKQVEEKTFISRINAATEGEGLKMSGQTWDNFVKGKDTLMNKNPDAGTPEFTYKIGLATAAKEEPKKDDIVADKESELDIVPMKIDDKWVYALRIDGKDALTFNSMEAMKSAFGKLLNKAGKISKQTLSDLENEKSSQGYNNSDGVDFVEEGFRRNRR